MFQQSIRVVNEMMEFANSETEFGPVGSRFITLKTIEKGRASVEMPPVHTTSSDRIPAKSIVYLKSVYDDPDRGFIVTFVTAVEYLDTNPFSGTDAGHFSMVVRGVRQLYGVVRPYNEQGIEKPTDVQ